MKARTDNECVLDSVLINRPTIYLLRISFQIHSDVKTDG